MQENQSLLYTQVQHIFSFLWRNGPFIDYIFQKSFLFSIPRSFQIWRVLKMISFVVLLLMAIHMSHTANPERYIEKTSFTNRNFDSRETSETESPENYYYKERRETSEDNPAKLSDSSSSFDDYIPKKYYVSREDFQNLELSLFDDHEPKKYYTKRAIREDDKEVRILYF